MSVNTLLQVRRGLASTWSSVDPTLAAGEFGYETDSKKFKIGDGSTAWSSLSYAAYTVGSDFTDAVNTLIPLVTGSNGVTATFSSNTYTLSLSDPTIQVANITDFVDGTNERINDLLTEGENIQLSYTDNNDDTSTLQISVTGLNSADISDFNSAVDARVTAASVSSAQVMDIVGTGVIGGTGIAISYDTNAFDGQITIDTSGLAYSDHDHTISDITDITANANEINVLDGVTAGTVAGGDAVVVNSSKDIGDFRYITASMFLGNTSGNLTGNADTATTATDATNVTVSANNSTDESVYIAFVDGATGSQGIETDTSLSYNPSTDTLSAGSLSVSTVLTTSNVTVGGNLVVNGTTTTVNSTTVDVGDNIIQVNVSGSEVLGGLQVYDHDNTETHKIVWDIEDSRWEFIGDTSPNVYTSGSVTASSFSGDGSNLTNISNIADGTIVNADISNSANVSLHKLVASGITLGDSEYILGSTTTALSGMTQLAGDSSSSPMYIYWGVVDGGSP